MNNGVPKSVEESCEWKRRGEAATASMSPRELIEFYRSKADEFQRSLGLDLPRRDASALDIRPRIADSADRSGTR